MQPADSSLFQPQSIQTIYSSQVDFKDSGFHSGNLQLPVPLLLVLLKTPMFLQPGHNSCLHMFKLLDDRVMTTEMVLDSWSRPRGSKVTVQREHVPPAAAAELITIMLL